MAKAIEGSLPHADLGPPVAPRWLGRLVKALLLRTGYMPPGTPAPRPFRPDEETSTPQALSRLALAVERFESLSKDERSCMSGHPFFGAMTYEEWHRTHLIHARHHIARFAGKGWLKEKGG
jgi:hypothetical protein